MKNILLASTLLILPLACACSSAQAAAKPAAAAQASDAPPPAIPVGTKMKCPVSGDDFTVKASTKQIVHDGKRYAFCCADCQPQFEKDPGKYTKK